MAALKAYSFMCCVFQCPHDLPCPRFMNDTTPCNFEVSYISLPFEGRHDVRKERFCYVVLKKGKIIQLRRKMLM